MRFSLCANKDATMAGNSFTLHTPTGRLVIEADQADVKDGAIVFSVRSGLRKRQIACFAPGTWSACHAAYGYGEGRDLDPNRVAAALKA